MGGGVATLGSDRQKLRIIFPKNCLFSTKMPPDLLFTILNTCFLYLSSFLENF